MMTHEEKQRVVITTVRVFVRTHPGSKDIGKNELISEAWLAVLEADQNFDPAKGATHRSWLISNIKWALSNFFWANRSQITVKRYRTPGRGLQFPAIEETALTEFIAEALPADQFDPEEIASYRECWREIINPDKKRRSTIEKVYLAYLSNPGLSQEKAALLVMGKKMSKAYLSRTLTAYKDRFDRICEDHECTP
jgi:hypothetical protein